MGRVTLASLAGGLVMGVANLAATPAVAGDCLDPPGPGDGDSQIRKAGHHAWVGAGTYVQSEQTLNTKRVAGEPCLLRHSHPQRLQ